MNFGLTLNVAISLTFVYVLASLLASTVNEMIAGALKLRGVYLTKAIESLTSLGSGNVFAWGGFIGWWHAYFSQSTAEVTRTVDLAAVAVHQAGEAAAKPDGATVDAVLTAIYAVRAIDVQSDLQQAIAAAATPESIQKAVRGFVAQAAKKGDNVAAVFGVTADAATAVAGADAVSVRAALHALRAIDLLPGLPDVIQQAAAAAGSTAVSVSAAVRPVGGMATMQRHPLLIGTPSSLPSYVASRDFASAMLSHLTDGSVANGFTQAQAAINRLPEGDVKQTLLAFISAGANDLDKLRTRIESWFDDSMERLSGIYKRFAQYVMFMLGLIIAFGMNVNSIQLTRMFWNEPALSSAISAGAAKFITDEKDQFSACPTTPAQGNGTNPDAPAICPPKARLAAVQDLIDQQNLPIGRATHADLFGCVKPNPRVGDINSPNACQLKGPKFWTIAGWLITAFAIAMGAQFWFGMLTNLTSLRAAGDKPPRANAVPPAS
jgi:hypothetical protein